MTDLSKHSLAELEALKRIHNAECDRRSLEMMNIDAEIEHRKSEPDWDAWEPKWQAFCSEASWISPTTFSKAPLIRALIAAHNTPLAGEGGWTMWERGMTVPDRVSPDTHEVQYRDYDSLEWVDIPEHCGVSWESLAYRYRPKQTGEARP